VRGGRIAAIAGIACLLGGGGAALLLARPGPRRTASAVAAPATTTVTRTDLATSLSLPGTLGYAGAQPVTRDAGHVTWLPRIGATVARGAPLLRVDDRPVSVFYGTTPLFRALTTPGVAGRDVRVLADNLTALGYDIGPQPPAGTLVRVPADHATARYVLGSSDAVLTRSLVTAVRRWQAAVGVPQTGVVDPDDVVVLPGALRVNAISAHLGDAADAPILTVSSTRKVVTVALKAGDVATVHVGDRAGVTLPDGTATEAHVSRIASAPPARGDDPAADDPALTATLTLPHRKDVRRLDGAAVQVEFTSEVRHHVLAAPVGALLALSGGGYGLQRPSGGLIAVRTGLFVKGMVEVRARGLKAGTRVVTTS
jgi:peptidoglycan hydrolase-like protein with peptidoglycan-binding domain